jgi:hypothetical protein
LGFQLGPFADGLPVLDRLSGSPGNSRRQSCAHRSRHQLGEKYGIHINLGLHRAPGYCILDTMDEALTGIHVTKEKSSVFNDPKMLDAFVYQWTYFAVLQRSTQRKLRFNLMNAPIVTPAPEQMEERQKAGKLKPEDFFNGEFARSHAADYTRVARPAIEAITKHDPQCLVVIDGTTAHAPIPVLFGTAVLQSCHTYHSVQLTHYQCGWVRSLLSGNEPVPTRPIKDSKGLTIDRAQLARTFQPWGELAAHRVPIRFGEISCYKHTPRSSPNVVQRHLERTRRSALRMGAVEISRTVRCSRYAARRHRVRRLARPPARPPASRPAAEKNEGVESDRPPRRHALLCVLCGMSLRLSGQKLLTAAEAQAYRPNARNEFSAWPTTSV